VEDNTNIIGITGETSEARKNLDKLIAESSAVELSSSA